MFRKVLKKTFLFVALLYVTLYLPLLFVVYFPAWYRLSCNWNPRCEVLGELVVEQGVSEITDYFRHQGDLVTHWSPKEKKHLAEVRQIYDLLFSGFGLALLLLVWSSNRPSLAKFGLINVVIITSLVLILPFFMHFWRDIFHPLLFNNDLWRTNKLDLTYYLTPRSFFKYTMALLILLSSLINVAVWYVFKTRG